MKQKVTFALTIGTVLFAGLIYGQERRALAKVDSPYRLLKGVIIKNDLRMAATVPNNVVFVELAGGVAAPDIQGNQVFTWAGNQPLYLNQRQAIIDPFQPINPSGFVVDGVLVNDNSQRFNAVLFPPFGYFWQID